MRKLLLLLLFVVSVLSACQLQKVMVDLYTPGKLVFPPDVRSVYITSRYVPATGPYEDIQWGAYESVDSLKWAMSESVVDTLGKLMAAENRFMVKVKHLQHILRHNDASLPDPLEWDGMLNTSKKELVQAFLMIEGFDISKTPVVVTENAGNFTAQYSIDVTLAIRFYEPEKRRMIDDSVYVFRSEFNGTGKTEGEAFGKLPDDYKVFFKACSNAAESYFKLICPGEIPAKRFYYNRGDTTLLKADLALKEGKWGRAESKWKWLSYNSPDTLIQSKASYNMALACERDGRLNQALGYARRSQRLKPNKQTVKYIDVLDNRLKDQNARISQGKIIKKW
jgi:hypothetical protein